MYPHDKIAFVTSKYIPIKVKQYNKNIICKDKLKHKHTILNVALMIWGLMNWIILRNLIIL